MNRNRTGYQIARIFLGIALIGFAWYVATRDGVNKAGFTDFYQTQISPLIDTAQTREKQAVDLALAKLHEHFDRYRRGVPRFITDVTTWGNRFEIAYRGVADLWNGLWSDKSKAASLQYFADQKFRDWVVNEQRLREALSETMLTFSEAMEASHNRLEGEIKLAIGRPECPVKIPVVQLDQYLASAKAASTRLARETGRDSALFGAAGFAGGWIATDAVMSLTTGIIARLAASSTATAAVSGSATVSGAAAGGGAGTSVGPLGTITGIVAGLVAGFAVDWWLNEKFKEKVSAQCGKYLDDLERDFTEGTGGHPGIKALLLQATRENSEGYRKALFTELQKAPRP